VGRIRNRNRVDTYDGNRVFLITGVQAFDV
jgi:hypothetical protein